MTNQSGVIKTNLELYRVVMGGSGGYRRLPGGSDDFLLQTDKQTLHHYIYIIIIIFGLATYHLVVLWVCPHDIVVRRRPRVCCLTHVLNNVNHCKVKMIFPQRMEHPKYWLIM